LLSIGMAFIPSCLIVFEIPLSAIGFSQEFSDGFTWRYQDKLFSVLIAGTFGFFFSMLFAPTEGSDHRRMVDKFFKTMKTPIDFEKEIGEGNDTKQLTAIGGFGASVAVFIGLLLFIPNPIEGRLAILALALVIGGVSALMIWAGRKGK